MANVLNRTTLQYLTSVNTPDHPDSDWVINPDMSGLIEPYPFWVLEGDSVRDMTAGEKSAWQAAHPQPVVIDTSAKYLADGTPAYYYPLADCNISIEKATVTFSTRTNGAKNFYLDLQNADSSTNGFPVKRKALIKSIGVSLRAAITEAVTVQIKGHTGNVLATAMLPANTKSTSMELSNAIADGEILSCCLLSNKAVSNPIVVCELAWRD